MKTETIKIKSIDLAKEVKALALDKKAEDLLILDMRGLTTITDYFVICTGTSTRHTRTIAEEITRTMKKKIKVPGTHTEGVQDGSWIVIDYIDIIVHIFDEENREKYQLENLWGDAEKIE
jgi:ribosome-associated protein